MADLVFTTQGQAEALAAQEAVAKKGREIRDEFEQGAKSVGNWDSSLSKLKGSAESALRSIRSEQENIAQQINAISEAQQKGLIPPEEAEQAVTRLKERWVEADEATKKQGEDAEKTARAHEELKRSAEHAIEQVATPAEKAAESIKHIGVEAAQVREAMEKGLVPKDVGEETIHRLNDRMGELRKQMGEVDKEGEHAGNIISHLFGEHAIVHAVGAYASIHGFIHIIKDELEDMQAKIDARQEHLLKPAERVEKLKADEDEAYSELKRSHETTRDAKQNLQRAEESAAKEQLAKQHDISEAQDQASHAMKEVSRAIKETSEAAAERTRKHREQASDEELQITRARENYLRHPSIETQREQADAAKRYQRTQRDFEIENDKAVKSEQQRVEEARRSQKAAQDRLAELQRRAGDTPESIVAARREVEDRQRGAKEAEQSYHEKRQARIDESNKGEFRRATRIQSRQAIVDRLNEELSQLGGENELSSKEIQKIGETLSHAGYDWIAKKLSGTPGNVPDEVARLREEAAYRREQIKAGHGPATSSGTGGPGTTYYYSPEQKEQFDKMATAMEKAADTLQLLLDEARNPDGGGLTNR
jgi:chromosome segregation ATPase